MLTPAGHTPLETQASTQGQTKPVGAQKTTVNAEIKESSSNLPEICRQLEIAGSQLMFLSSKESIFGRQCLPNIFLEEQSSRRHVTHLDFSFTEEEDILWLGRRKSEGIEVL